MGRSSRRPALFLDKDGTLIENVPYNVDVNRIKLTWRSEEGLRILARQGFQFVVVSNQAGVALGYFDEAALASVSQRLHELCHPYGVTLSGVYYCPHHPEGRVEAYRRKCDCRKPQPGLLFRAAEELNLDLERSWLIGDTLDDIEAGHRAGCRTALLDNGGETEWNVTLARMPLLAAANLDDAARQILQHMAKESDWQVKPTRSSARV